jgi:adenine-specific DNA-methyltransferase
MKRAYFGIENGEHIKTHCAHRLKKVIAGEPGGISKLLGWTGGGGFDFYQLNPSGRRGS